MAHISQNHSVKSAKSTPCIESPPLLDHAINDSDHSLLSYKSCNAVEDRKTDKSISENNRPSVKALINKHKLFQEKLFNAKVTKFNLNKKTFTTACENLYDSSNDRIHMEGDSKRKDDVDNFVRF